MARKSRKICSAQGCGRVNRSKGFCGMHYRRWRTFGDPGGPAPKTRRQYKICKVPDCLRSTEKDDLCSMHIRRLGHGRSLGCHMTRSEKFRSDGSLDGKGYRRIYQPAHPNANNRGIVLEHVAVMSNILGRPLCKGETVHHINGVRSDNHSENLELWTRSHPPGQRVKDRIAEALCLLADYAGDLALWPDDKNAMRLSFLE